VISDQSFSEYFSKVLGRLFYVAGWVISTSSILLGCNKTAESRDAGYFWGCFAVLLGVSIIYSIGRVVSPQWRSPEVRKMVSPYLVGTAIWTIVFVFFFVLDLADRWAR